MLEAAIGGAEVAAGVLLSFRLWPANRVGSGKTSTKEIVPRLRFVNFLA